MSRARILVVEDNARSRKLLRDVLGHHGYEVHEAESGEAGVTLACRVAPQLIMMDIQLPDIDGVEALRRLRHETRTRAIPVIAVTASVVGAEIRRLRDAGFDAHLAKPVALKELLAAVEGLLAGHAAAAAP